MATSSSTKFAEWATIIATAATVIISLVSFAYSFGKLETRVETLEKDTKDIPAALTEIKVNLASVKELPNSQKDLLYRQERIEKLLARYNY